MSERRLIVMLRARKIDYDREIAIVPELTEDGKRRILGVVRVGIEPDGKAGEIAFIVADPWQGLGLGTKLVDYAIKIAKDMKIETLYAIMLVDNYRAISLMKKMGFTITYMEDGPVRGTLNLKEEELRVPCIEPKPAEQPQAQSQPAQTEQKESKEAEALQG